VPTGPFTVTTGDDVDVLNSTNDSILDYQQDGRLWLQLWRDATPDRLEYWYSANAGETWTQSSTSNIDNANGQGAFFIDKDDYAHVAYYDTVLTENVYRLGTPTGDHTGFVWGSPVILAASLNGSGCNCLVAHREGSGWVAHVVAAELDGGGALTHFHWKIPIDSAHTIGTPVSTTIKAWGASLSSACSLDFRHTATDSKDVQSSTPSLYFVVSDLGGALDPGLLYYKATYSAGAWSWSAEVEITTAQQSALPSLVYDGTRVMIATMNTATTSVVRVWERDEANTTSTARDPTALGLGTIQSLSLSVGRNSDVWLVANENTNRDLQYIRFDRTGLTWGSWTVLEADTLSNSGAVSMPRGMSPVGIACAYQIAGTSPDQVHFSMLVSNFLSEALLQGVGSVSPQANLGFASEALLQGVGSISATAALALAGNATLQGVGNMEGKSLLTPFRDFTVYDAYLDGLGLFGPGGLIYYEEESAKKTTVSQQLRPARTDTGDQPTEVRPESGEVFSQQDASHGAGQLYAHHPGQDTKRFLWSEGFDVDIDTVGQPATLIHQHAVAQSLASSSPGKIVVFADTPFVIDGTSIKRNSGVLPGVWTDDVPHGAEAPTTPGDMVSSGEFLYAALGVNGIHRRDTAGTWTHWSDVQATRVAWVKNRIMASNGPSIYEVITGGAAPTPIETLPAGWAFESIFEVSGFVYATAVSRTSELSRIHAYKLNAAGTALEKRSETPFPRDQLIVAGSGYLDNVLLGGGIKNRDGGFDPVVYQAGVTDQDTGALSYAKVSEGEGAGSIDLSVKAFEAVGEDVVFSWTLGSGFAFGARDGLALLKLKVGGFFPYLKVDGAGENRAIESVTLWKGALLFTVKGKGVYYEDTTKFVSDAYLVSSVADYQTTAKKVWDLAQVSHAPLPASTSVFMDVTTRLPADNAWDLAITSDIDDAEIAETRFDDLSSRLLAVRIRSVANPGGSQAPKGIGFLVRSNLLPDTPEWNLTRYIRLMKQDRKDRGGEDVYLANVQATLKAIQGLSYRIVNLYEPGVKWTVRVDRVADMTPFLPRYWETGGEEREDVYVLQLTMSGVRD